MVSERQNVAKFHPPPFCARLHAGAHGRQDLYRHAGNACVDTLRRIADWWRSCGWKCEYSKQRWQDVGAPVKPERKH
jgi:hypothetical protein